MLIAFGLSAPVAPAFAAAIRHRHGRIRPPVLLLIIDWHAVAIIKRYYTACVDALAARLRCLWAMIALSLEGCALRRSKMIEKCRPPLRRTVLSIMMISADAGIQDGRCADFFTPQRRRAACLSLRRAISAVDYFGLRADYAPLTPCATR